MGVYTSLKLSWSRGSGFVWAFKPAFYITWYLHHFSEGVTDVFCGVSWPQFKGVVTVPLLTGDASSPCFSDGSAGGVFLQLSGAVLTSLRVCGFPPVGGQNLC
eukprot:Gb_40935 [translate_table: standard]